LIYVPGSVAGVQITALGALGLNSSQTTLRRIIFGAGGSYTALSPTILSGFTQLQSVDLPSNVTTLGNSCFSGCTALESVSMPPAPNIIVSAFEGCTALDEITMPSALEEIYDGAFRSCAGLTTISIPATVNRLNDSAFADCSGLLRVDFYRSGLPTYTGDFLFSPISPNLRIYVPNGSRSKYLDLYYFTQISSQIIERL